MPSFTFDRESIYWRPLCRNRLYSKSSAANIPCDVCIYPVSPPPKIGCGCNSIQRPGGLPRTMTLTLPGVIPQQIPSSTLLTTTTTDTVTCPLTDTGMSPPDGAKTTTRTIVRTKLFKALTTDTVLLMKEANPNKSECTWINQGVTFRWQKSHDDIIRMGARQEFTVTPTIYNLSGKALFTPIEILLPAQKIAGNIDYDNDDFDSRSAFIDSGCYAGDPPRIPQLVNNLPWPFYAIGSPYTCNRNMFPVSPYCHNKANPSVPYNYFTGDVINSYWKTSWIDYGYYWILKPHGSNFILTLYYKNENAEERTVTVSGAKPRAFPNYYLTPNNRKHYVWVGNGGTPLNDLQYDGGCSDSAYPLSYHTNIPQLTAYGLSRGECGARPVPGGYGFFGGAIPGFTVYDPSWGGLSPINVGGGGTPIYDANLSMLGMWISKLPWPGGCSQTGNVTLHLYFNYRNVVSNPVYAGPTSLPSTINLNIGP